MYSQHVKKLSKLNNNKKQNTKIVLKNYELDTWLKNVQKIST